MEKLNNSLLSTQTLTLEENEYGALLSKRHDSDLKIMSTTTQLEGAKKQ